MPCHNLAVCSSGSLPPGDFSQDIGDIAGGIHPHNKTEVGRRLAFAVRRQVFNRTSLPDVSVPVSAEMTTSTQLSVNFAPAVTALSWGPTHNCSACCTPHMRVLSVEVPGQADWVNLPATIANEGQTKGESTVSLRATVPADMSPSSARYAWSDFPQCVLFDQNGLPVGPFTFEL